MQKQLILDKAGLAAHLKVSPRMVGVMVRKGLLPEPVKLGHRTHRYVVDPDAPLTLPPQSK